MSAGVLRFGAAFRRSDRLPRSLTVATRRLRAPLGRCGFELFFDKLIRLQRLLVDFVEAWDAIVPLEQGRSTPDSLDRVRVEPPNWIEHRMIVRVENVFLKLRMPRDVNLSDPMRRDIV